MKHTNRVALVGAPGQPMPAFRDARDRHLRAHHPSCTCRREMRESGACTYICAICDRPYVLRRPADSPPSRVDDHEPSDHCDAFDGSAR